ncbi:hypothetical protein D3C77_425120 [compost metagenome]
MADAAGAALGCSLKAGQHGSEGLELVCQAREMLIALCQALEFGQAAGKVEAWAQQEPGPEEVHGP